MKRSLNLVIGTLLLLLPAIAFAQGGADGSIVGYVFDQGGNPIRGVKVSASSPTQIGGTKVSYSNAEGEFRIRQLTPGVFEVRATAPTLRAYIQKDVKVGITSAVELNLVMEVEGAVEQVTVVQKAPLVSVSKPNLKEEFDSDFVEALPHHTRDNIHRDMLASVAGAVSNRMRGGAANQTVLTQDGFEMGSPGKIISPALKSSAAFEVQTAGYGADNPTASGGVLNLVTRSGSNRYEFEVNATADDSRLYFFTDQRDSKASSFYYVINPTIAGPIIKDKLWFFFNTETHLTQDGRQRDVNGQYPDPIPTHRFIQKGTIKLTWQASPRNKLSAITNYELPNEWNRIDGFGIAPEAQETRHTQRIFVGAIWEALLRDNLVMKNQVGAIYIPEHIYPALCDQEPVACDQVPSIMQTAPLTLKLQNDNNHSRTDVYSLQVVNSLDWFPEGRTLGEHAITLRNRFYTEQEVRKQSRPGDQLLELSGFDNVALTNYYSNDPRYEAARKGWWIGTDYYSKDTLTLSDAWKPTRHLNITPALSWVWATASDSAGNSVINTWTLAPGLSAVWDATHDGRTALRASASTYVDIDVSAIARHAVGSQAQQRCRWNTADNMFDLGCVFSGGLSQNTFGHPCSPNGLTADGTSCLSPLQIPRTYEATVGGEREITPGIAVSLDFIYKKYTHQYEVSETNRIWNPGGTEVVGYKNGRPVQIMDMSTPAGAERLYDGFTLGLNKREGRLKARLDYTWAQLKGTVFNGSNNAWGDIPSRDVYLYGYLPDDHRHEIKATVGFQATPWLSFGTRTIYLSGMPYDHLYRSTETTDYNVYRATRGTNAGANVNDPGDDRALRMPDQLELNAQVRVNLAPFIKQKLELYADVLNVLALRTATTLGTNDGVDFGTERAWMQPFRVRLGLNYRY
jgi:hypothetical protein